MGENRIRVLLVEDNPGDARWLRNFLIEAPTGESTPSFDVVHVDRLGQALDRLAEESFDLILLDLTLPNSQGLSTLHQILEAAPDLPVVIISGLRGRQLALAAVEAGAQDYLMKSQITPDSLPRTLQYAIARKRDQKVLQEREARYRALLESTPCLICTLAPNGDTLFVNPYVASVTGYSPAELIGRNWWDLFYPGELRAQVHALYAAFEKGDVRDYEMTLVDRQGRRRVLSWSSFNVRDKSQGQLIEIHGVGLDITERKRMEEDLRRRTAQLTALHEVGLELAGQLDLGVLLRTIVERAVIMLGGQMGSLGLYQPDHDILSEILTVGRAPIQGTTALRRGEGMFGRVLQTGQPLLLDDYQRWPGRLPAYEHVPLRGVMAVPIRWGDEFLGVLGVGSHAPGAFSPEDLELLGLLAMQAATAIHNARLFAAERTARQQAERLYAAAQALSASLDLSQVFSSILSELQQVVPYDSASVQQLQGETLRIIGGHGFPNLNELLGVSFDLNADDNPNREVVRTRQPLILDDAPLLYAGFRRDPHRQANIRSWLGVPLLFGDRLIGMIALDKHEPGFYTQEHARLAMAFAAQAAIAIENARLYQEAHERLRELTLLFETSATLATSLDRETVLHTIARQMVSALGVEGCALSWWDQEKDALVTLLDYASDAERWKPVPPGTVYHLSDYPASRWVLTERQPLVVQRSNHHADPGERSWMTAEGVSSALLVPLVVADQAVGLLELMESEQERHFSPNEIRLCQTLANQAAAALENARLYEEARRRNRELALLNRVIAASATTSRVETILETACRELALAFQLPQSGAALLNAARTEAVVVAEYHTEGRPSALGAIIPVEGNPSFQFLLTEKRPLVIDDATSDPRLSPVHDLMRRRDVASILLLPLLVEGEVVGSLGLDALEARRFTPEEVELAWRVAEQVGGALARARLEEERVRLSTAIEQAAESVLITDRQGVITYANPALERISGYSRAELLGQTPRLFKSGRHDSAFYRRLWETIQSGQAWQGRFINRRKDGQLYYEDTTIAPLRDAAGQIVGYVSTGRDVTQEVSLEEQFRQAQKMEAVGQLAGGVAHDFNNLLTIIQLSARLMGKQIHAEDPLQVQLERIQEACHRANELTKQLLTFSRQAPLETRRVDLNDSIREMSRMLPRLLGEDIELVLALSEDLWPVVGDANQLDQVLLNLAVNARDAMPQGGRLRIETANVVLDRAYTEHHFGVEPGEYVMLAVSDTGVGMSEEVKARIFEPFFTTKGSGQGTGLGLSTVYGIVKRHGGHIGVYSEVGQGSTFKVYLPRIQEEPRRPHKTSSVVSEPPRGTETILVVEDEATVREMITQILNAHGFRALTAADGPEALQLSREHQGPIHLLLTDLVMPSMSGVELAEQLRADRPELRVIYMSGYPKDELMRRKLVEEQAVFLIKPLTEETLIQTVQAVLCSTGDESNSNNQKLSHRCP